MVYKLTRVELGIKIGEIKKKLKSFFFEFIVYDIPALSTE